MMLAIDVCNLPDTGGSMFVLIAGLFVLVAGVIVTRWVRQSAGRLSVVVAPLVLLGGLVLAPQVVDPCAPATTTVAPSVTTVAPTTTTTTTLAPVVYQVGSPGPSGGIIFYVDETRNEGPRYFDVACAGWSDGECGGNDLTDPQAEWGCYGSSISGADGTAIGTGEQNTTDITALVGGCSTAGIAARLANDLVLGGQVDWFLPSKDELNQLCRYAWNLTISNTTNTCSGMTGTIRPGFSTDTYSSSSDFSDGGAWVQSFDDGYDYFSYKDYTFYVRPVRAF